MNKVDLPNIGIDEAQNLRAIANNRRLGSYPRLVPAVDNIVARYGAYMQGAGFVAPAPPPGAVTDDQADLLGRLFTKPPKALGHITDLRRTTRHRSCPMCGSFLSGTLDHLLPRNSHPEFSVFTPNLVHACDCNSKRGSVYAGAVAGERVLHPYFDQCLSQRLIVAGFDDLGLVPRVSLRLTPEAIASPHFVAIRFHVENVVKRTAITTYLGGQWADLCRQPSIVLRFLENPVQSLEDLRSKLERELDLLDRARGGARNNWNSIFAAGLLELHVLTWLFDRTQEPGRSPNDPLLV
jgi:hypothetical protein